MVRNPALLCQVPTTRQRHQGAFIVITPVQVSLSQSLISWREQCIVNSEDASGSKIQMSVSTAVCGTY
jgi:hypothetical protein